MSEANPTMDIRRTIDFFKQRGDLFVVSKSMDPVYEIAGVLKQVDGGPAILFESIKGYPEVRNIANLFSRRAAVASLFGVPGPEKITAACHSALKQPIPPQIVTDPPCQEVVIDGNVDVFAHLPILKHTEDDAGRILGGVNVLISGDYFDGGHEISFKRMHFRGKDWSSLMAGDHSHTGMLSRKFKGQKVPVTLNINPPPAVTMMAGSGSLHTVVPYGCDELAIAGGLQGYPVDICKAKTVDAFSVANAEFVIEGHLNFTQKVWESDAAEASGKWGDAPYFPEHGGYMGHAVKTLFFEATAITHRKDRPIFYSPLAHSIEGNNLCAMFRAATIMELGERMMPGLMVDANVLDGQKGQYGAVIQVNKGTPRQEGYQKNFLRAVMSMPEGPQVVIAVDEDINIYSAEDVIWAMSTRVNTETGILTTLGDLKRRGNPMENLAREYGQQGAIGIDATIPVKKKSRFHVGHYPVDKIDLNDLFSEEDLNKIRNLQSDYGRLLGLRGA